MDINVSSEAMAKIAAFRGVYVLCRVNIKEKKLTAQYLASCLTSGRTPMWGVFERSVSAIRSIVRSDVGLSIRSARPPRFEVASRPF